VRDDGGLVEGEDYFFFSKYDWNWNLPFVIYTFSVAFKCVIYAVTWPLSGVPRQWPVHDHPSLTLLSRRAQSGR